MSWLRATATFQTRTVSVEAGRTALLALVIGCGAALRLFDLGGESYWVDEIVTLQVAERFETVVSEAFGGRPPMFMGAMHGWLQLFGDGEAAARSLPALISIVSLALMFLVARELFGREVALLSVVAMAASSHQVYHAQNIRYYSLLVLMVLVSFLMLIKYARSGRAVHLGLYAVSAVAMFYTHTHGVFVLAAQGLFVLTLWRVRRRFLAAALAQALVGLAVLPMLYVTMRRTVGGDIHVTDWLDTPTLASLPLTLIRFVYAGPTPALLGYVLLGAAIVACGLAARFGRNTGALLAQARRLAAGARVHANGAALLLWLVCPIGLPFVLSFVVGPMYSPNYTIAAAPALFMLLGLLVWHGRTLVPLPLALAALLVPAGLSLYAYYDGNAKEPWREIAQYVQERDQAASVVVFADNNWPLKAFERYYRGERPTCGLAAHAVETDDELFRDLERCAPQAGRFWLIDRSPSTRAIERVTRDYLPDERRLRVIDVSAWDNVTLYLVEYSGP